MRSKQQLHFICQPYAHARAVAQVQELNRHKVIKMFVFSLASAIIALWMAYFLNVTGSILTNLNIMPTHLLSSASDNDNRANKDEQLTSVQFNDRWNAFATMKIQTLGERGVRSRATGSARNLQRILVGLRAGIQLSRLN
jgi:hypothetical protein